MGINGRRPFQEMVEVCQNELVREAASNQEDKFKGLINQVYMNELPSVLPEEYIKKEAFITLAADYTTGTVTVGSGTAGIHGTTTSWTSAYNNFIAKVSGRNRLYRMTYSADTLLTFQNSLTWVESSGTALTYTLMQDRYAVASDFAYMAEDDHLDPNIVYRSVSYQPLFLTPLSNEEYDRKFAGIVGDPFSYTVKWISETPYLMVLFAPDSADILAYKYIPQLTTLKEYTTGTVTFAASTAVVGAGGMAWTTNVDTASNTYYIRNDVDGSGSSSKWTKILSVANASAMTLSATYAYTTGAAQTYTISEVSKWPARFDDAMIYKAAMIADPDNTQVKKWTALYQESISLDKTVEMKRINVRPLKQFFGMRNNK